MQGSLAYTTVRNEGPFLLEWIAWQKMLGFERILILFNDCTDHSPQLLRLLERAGEIACKRHFPDREGLPPQPSALKACRNHPFVKDCEWMFNCDVDEYLVIHKGDGTIGALLNNGDVPFVGLSVHWRIFGSNGIRAWEDGFVHRRFARSAPSDAPQNNCVKTFLRQPLRFGKLRTHTPRFWQGEGAWNEDDNHLVLSDGRVWGDFDPDTNLLNGTAQELVTHKVAELNHYILQTWEQYEHKRGRPSAAEGLDRYTERFFKRFDHNSTPNDTVTAYADRFDAEYARLCAIPGVMRLHHLCCADYVEEMRAKRGRDPRDDPRWQHHRAEAKRLSTPSASAPTDVRETG
ncbi:glycosyltransferase family 2 protein [Aliiroseovarius sp.]|uniref:glycosyltransferase family 2 protein n=1 Tax=Aliiroseovarius sp. TaxID=1872442 RepID=UPI003BAB7DC9